MLLVALMITIQVHNFENVFNVVPIFKFIFKMLILGRINEDYLRELLTTMGDRFTDEQVDDMFREAPINQKTNDFNYVEVSRHFLKIHL